METKNGHHSGNSFLWGLVIGGLLATLLTTKRGRLIIKELTDLGLELFEDFVEQKASSKKVEPQEDLDEEAASDIESEIAAVETVQNEEEEPIEEKVQAEEEIKKESKTKEEVPLKNGNGQHHKKRLFRGIRK